MANFSIKFINQPFLDEESGELLCYGEIKIDYFKESFLASLSFWNQANYQAHWKDSLQKIASNNFNQSCLITSMYNPQYANFIFWWILYKEDQIVHIQNHVLFLETISEGFKIENIHSYIPEREIYTEDGETISEWSIDIKEIKDFITDKSL